MRSKPNCRAKTTDARTLSSWAIDENCETSALRLRNYSRIRLDIFRTGALPGLAGHRRIMGRTVVDPQANPVWHLYRSDVDFPWLGTT